MNFSFLWFYIQYPTNKYPEKKKKTCLYEINNRNLMKCIKKLTYFLINCFVCAGKGRGTQIINWQWQAFIC